MSVVLNQDELLAEIESLRQQVNDLQDTVATQQVYVDVVETGKLAIWEADPFTFAFTYVNPATTDLLGYSPRQWLEEPRFWLDHIHPEDREWVASFCQSAITSHQNHEMEYRLLAADDRVVWVRDKIMVVAEQGQVTKLQGVMVDITRYKQMEDGLSVRHSMSRTLVDDVPDYIYQLTAFISDHIYVSQITGTGDFINLYLSPHAEPLTGYALEQLVADWNLWASQIIHPDDRQTAAAQAARLARGEDSEVEYRIVRKTGEVLWVRDRAKVRVEGQSKYVYGLVSDITERKLGELEREWLTQELRRMNQTLDERVRARTAELRAMLDAVGEGVVVTDVNGIIQYINPALERMIGYTQSEALGRKPNLWQSTQHDRVFYDQMWHTILSGQTWRGEIINRRKDGSTYEAVLTITPIIGPDGQFLGFVGAQHDITPFKEMDRLKSEFISNAAHELRTPLTSIQGFSEILLTRQLNHDRQDRYLKFINQQAIALAAIIEDLLDLSRLESKRGFEMVQVAVNIQELVEQVLFGFQENNKTTHTYEVIGPEVWPQLQGDPAKLGQLFKNLVSNATKYSPNGGTVTLTAEVIADYNLLYLTLADQGIGMSAEQVAHVFDRFYRANASNTAIGGTGLGMTISRLIVERHGGRIWLASEPGHGTTVHLMFPLPNRPTYILIIEDDEALQEVQRRTLELAGYTVLSASDGRAGLELAQHCMPNLVLLDLALPGMTGFNVWEQFQASSKLRGTPVIITSAMDKPQEIERAIAQGVTDYLVKPYGMQDLMVRVSRALHEARQETISP